MALLLVALVDVLAAGSCMESLRSHATSKDNRMTATDKCVASRKTAEEKIFIAIHLKTQTRAGTEHREPSVKRQAEIGGRKSGPSSAKECSAVFSGGKVVMM